MQTPLNKFYEALSEWIDALDDYSFDMLCIKPSIQSWSIGQVYMHLYSETSYYLEQARSCMQNDDNASGEMTEEGKIMFANDAFPDEQIEGPPENSFVQQPKYKEELTAKFSMLLQEVQSIKSTLNSHLKKGKTRHPGLGYFSAVDWVQFAGMHLRHHLRQKARIDQFLHLHTNL